MQPSKDPLHGITLEALLNALVAKYGWAELAKRININCFKSDPSIKSSLKFLRRTPWARKEVEDLYIDSLGDSTSTATPLSAESPWANWQNKRVGRKREALQHRLATERPWRFAGDALKGPTEGG